MASGDNLSKVTLFETDHGWRRRHSDLILDAVYIVLNMVSVVSVVVLLKWLFQPPYNFDFPNLLVVMHFLCTAVMVNICAFFGMFTPKRIPALQYVRLAASQVGSVCFVNLSLLFNSVGMYQVLKFTNIPVICLFEFLWMGTTYTMPIYASLALIVAGVTATSVTELKFSLVGFIWGMLGTVSTAIYQIQNKHIQQTYGVNAMQILQYESFLTAFFASIFVGFYEDFSKLMNYQWTTQAMILIASSCIAAFGVNVTCYLVIGRTSPVTYGVTGHLKTIMILTFGFTFLKQPLRMANLTGIIVAFCGIVWYTHIKLNERSKQTVAAATDSEIVDKSVTSVTEDDTY